MANRLAQVFITVIPIFLLAACSSKHAVRNEDGLSQSTQPQDSLFNSPSTILVSPDGDADNAYRPSSDVFPRPSELEPQVKFWRQVYSRWSRSQFAIHDKLYMNVVYEVFQLPEEPGERLSSYQKGLVQDRFDYWRRRLGEVEDKLAAGAMLSGDDQSLVQQLRQATGSRDAIFGASQRLRYQRGLKERFRRGLEIGSRYDRQFRQIFRDAGLPEELAYLPHVESSFQYDAHSSAGALGIWQFTAGAARVFMNGDDSAEARLDPIASTYGAARYLSTAYNKLGSWPLAITSYNHGIGGMQRAKSLFGHDFSRIVKEYDHPQFGFASRNYYAEFLAALDIVHEPERFFQEGESRLASRADDSLVSTASFVPPPSEPPVPEPDAISPPSAPVLPQAEEAAPIAEPEPQQADATAPAPEPVPPPIEAVQTEALEPTEETAEPALQPQAQQPVVQLAQAEEDEQADADETPAVKAPLRKALPAAIKKSIRPAPKAAPAESKNSQKLQAPKAAKLLIKKTQLAMAKTAKPARPASSSNRQAIHPKAAGHVAAKKFAEPNPLRAMPANYRAARRGAETHQPSTKTSQKYR